MRSTCPTQRRHRGAAGAPGGNLELLNGQKAELAPDMLVIADANGPMALGRDHGRPTNAAWSVSRSTYFWSPRSSRRRRSPGARAGWACPPIRRIASSAASILPPPAAQWNGPPAADASICGGKPGPITEISGRLPQRQPIPLRLARLKRVLGIELTQVRWRAMLAALGLQIERKGGSPGRHPAEFPLRPGYRGRPGGGGGAAVRL